MTIKKSVNEIAKHVERITPVSQRQTPVGIKYSPKIILMVDDDRTHRDFLRLILEREGYVISEATDGVKALDVLRSMFFLSDPQGLLPNLIILDVMMPVMNGLEFYVQLKFNKTFRDIPVLLITGDENLANHPSVVCLRKPVDIKTLLENIKRHAK